MAFDPVTAIGNVIGVVGDIIKARVPDVNQRAALENEITKKLIEMDWLGLKGQLDANIEEAKHQSVFVAGWRPFIGWTCGSALAYNFIGQPLMAFFAGLWLGKAPFIPMLDNSDLMAILLGMLGLGGMRTWEKIKGNGKAGG